MSHSGKVYRKSDGKFSSLSKRKNRMLERDSRSHTQNGVFSSSLDGDSTKEASSLASERTTFSSQVSNNSNADSHSSEFCVVVTIIGGKPTGFNNNSSSTDPLSGITHTGNDLSFFENTEVNDSSDFLFYGWPGIENFEDIDKMFRYIAQFTTIFLFLLPTVFQTCDSTFGLGPSREDELGWFSSSEGIRSTGELVNSDFKFSCPDSVSMKNLSTDHDSLKNHSSNEAAMISAPVRLRDSHLISEIPGSYVSCVNGHAEEGLIPKTEIKEYQKLLKLQNQPVGKRNGLDYTSELLHKVVELPSRAKSTQAFSSVDKKQTEHILGTDSCSYLQNHVSYDPPDSSSLSGLTSVNPSSSAVKTETNELRSQSTRDSSHASNQLTSTDGPHDPILHVITPIGTVRREKPHNRHSRSPVESNIKPADIMMLAISKYPGSIEKESLYAGDNPETHSDLKEFLQSIPAELGSSTIQESSTSSGMGDISLEAASFPQLQLVMEQYHGYRNRYKSY